MPRHAIVLRQIDSRERNETGGHAIVQE